MKCLFPKCRHYYPKSKCKYFTFPKPGDNNFWRWKSLLRLTGKSINSIKDPRVCSCHFKDEDKNNDPLIVPGKSNIIYFKSPECRKPKRKERITNDNVEQQDINIDQDDDTPSILQSLTIEFVKLPDINFDQDDDN